MVVKAGAVAEHERTVMLPALLVIMDGCGLGVLLTTSNAVACAKHPVHGRSLYVSTPTPRSAASGDWTWVLPDGQMGNCEVGHTQHRLLAASCSRSCRASTDAIARMARFEHNEVLCQPQWTM